MLLPSCTEPVMERFYLTVARIAKKTLHHMVEHRIPMLPDIYSRHFYRFLSSTDEESQEVIEDQQLNNNKEVRNQQAQSSTIMKELAMMIDKLDQVTGKHTEQLDNHILNLKDFDIKCKTYAFKEKPSANVKGKRKK